MWVIQNTILVELPDDAPLPPGSTVVELPEDFLDDPEAYVIERQRISRRPHEEVEALRSERAANRLTKADLAHLKRVVADQSSAPRRGGTNGGEKA